MCMGLRDANSAESANEVSARTCEALEVRLPQTPRPEIGPCLRFPLTQPMKQNHLTLLISWKHIGVLHI
jgi:hypothetical protein